MDELAGADRVAPRLALRQVNAGAEVGGSITAIAFGFVDAVFRTWPVKHTTNGCSATHA